VKLLLLGGDTMYRKRMRLLMLAAIAAALGGCANGDKLVEDGNSPDSIPTDLTEPAAVIESHAQALTKMDFDAYEALMEKPGGFSYAGFRFYFRSDDADEFLWLIGDSWDLDTESDMIRNMMDPEYDGAEPAVETMTMTLRILDEQILGDRVELAVEADIAVLVTPDDGWVANPQLVFTLAPDADGFLRIRSIREVDLTPFASPDPSIVVGSWGRIKARYRSPPPDIPVDLTRPLQVIESHARTFAHKDIEAYAALLAPEFEYYVRPFDAADFPWLEGDSWDIVEELGMMTNMMDPNFQGAVPPVRIMEFDYVFLREEIVGQGMVEILLNADVLVLVSADNGWRANTRFEFLLVQDTGGFYRIREIRELPVVIRSEESSWGQIKAAYRS
jgi:hypothetical protein